MTKLAALALALVVGPAVSGQVPIDDDDKHSWGENFGYMNWKWDDGVQQVLVHDSFLSGYVWCENLGWLHLGQQFAIRQSYGVDVAPDGKLSGFAWGENFGWVNFGGGDQANPPRPARVDFDERRLRGYAWGENVGWINLDDSSIFVSLAPCPCEVDGLGAQVNIGDLLFYLDLWFSGDAEAECDNLAGVTVADLLCFLACWFSASSGEPCPSAGS